MKPQTPGEANPTKQPQQPKRRRWPRLRYTLKEKLSQLWKTQKDFQPDANQQNH